MTDMKNIEDALTRMTKLIWAWGESCGIDDIRVMDQCAGDSHNQFLASRALIEWQNVLDMIQKEITDAAGKRATLKDMEPSAYMSSKTEAVINRVQKKHLQNSGEYNIPLFKKIKL